MNLRNIAIIAHVDHGKTTLVDRLLQQSGVVPRQPAGGRARDGFQRSRARARHHHSRQGHLDPLAGHPHQHRRHAWPRRFRRRGRAHSEYGRRRAGAGRRRRGPPAADQVRRVQGSEDGPEADRRDQQGRSPRCAPGGSGERGVRSVRRARCLRRAARLPDSLRLGQRGLDGRERRRAEKSRHAAPVRPRAEACLPAQDRGGSVPPARHDLRGKSVSWPDRHRPHHLRLDRAEPAGEGARPYRQAGRAGPRVQGACFPRA